VTVAVVETLGADAYLYGTVSGTGTEVIVRAGGRDQIRMGEVVHVTADPRSVHLFDTATGLRLN